LDELGLAMQQHANAAPGCSGRGVEDLRAKTFAVAGRDETRLRHKSFSPRLRGECCRRQRGGRARPLTPSASLVRRTSPVKRGRIISTARLGEDRAEFHGEAHVAGNAQLAL